MWWSRLYIPRKLLREITQSVMSACHQYLNSLFTCNTGETSDHTSTSTYSRQASDDADYILTSIGVAALTLNNYQSTIPDCPRRLRSSSPSCWLFICCLCHHVSIRTKWFVCLLILHLCTVCCNHSLPLITNILLEINSTCMYLASQHTGEVLKGKFTPENHLRSLLIC